MGREVVLCPSTLGRSEVRFYYCEVCGADAHSGDQVCQVLVLVTTLGCPSTDSGVEMVPSWVLPKGKQYQQVSDLNMAKITIVSDLNMAKMTIVSDLNMAKIQH